MVLLASVKETEEANDLAKRPNTKLVLLDQKRVKTLKIKIGTST